MARKTVSAKDLAARRARWKAQGRKVVFTNGVFDILHAGHVQILERAKALGDVLIVGLNSDASARGLGKGPGRPINSSGDRAAVLSALSAVDFVVGFDEPTPENLVRALKPDILVKGADYKKKGVAGAAFAGKVVCLPLKKGRSTTALLRRIRK